MIDKKQIVGGILIWALVLGAFVTLIGVGDFVEQVREISSSEFGLMLVAVGAGVVSMGSCLYVIARSLDLGGGLVETIFLNTSVSLAHNLTPFGQVGGAPIGAVILSQRFDGNYEESLAALSMKDVISFVPAILVFVFGGLYIVLFEQAIPDPLRPIMAAFALFVVAIVTAVLAVRRFPEYMQALLRRLVAGLNGIASRLPLVPSLEPDEVNSRVVNFSESIGQVASDRKTVVLSSALATSAFVAQGCLLWITLHAIGVDISIPLAIFTVQASLLASGLPLPGGSGGVEGAQVLILTTMVGAAADPVGTAVVLSRGLVFWTPIVLGSITLFVFQLQGTFDVAAEG